MSGWFWTWFIGGTLLTDGVRRCSITPHEPHGKEHARTRRLAARSRRRRVTALP
jgi:hypothetical protein